QTGLLRKAAGTSMAHVTRIVLLAGAAIALQASLGAAQAPSVPAVPANKIPNFMDDDTVGWLAAGNEYIPMETGPHPVTPDPAHPYIQGAFGGRQPTLRVADLNNPILQPWVKQALKKVNDRVLAGKPA